MNTIEKLRHSRPAILPSMLQNDFSNIGQVCQQLEDANADGLHLDVMDGTFVPNISYGIPIVSAFRKSSDLILDCHLMINDPENYIPQFVEAGADLVTFHIEATKDPIKCIELIRDAGACVGVALNPNTPIESLQSISSQCDLILIMSVHAGFGGQSFIKESLQRVEKARELDGNFLLEIDGGINASTIGSCGEAGVDLFVVGSAIFGKEDYAKAVSELSELAGAQNDHA